MKLIRSFPAVLSFGALSLVACNATIGDGSKSEEFGPSLDEQQQVALVNLQGLAGGPIRLELNERGGVNVLSMEPGHNLISAFGAPDDIANNFIRQHAPLFRLDNNEASEFEATRVDKDSSGLTHVVMQRVIDGVPVFQGVISVHMDASNSVFNVLGNDNYNLRRPINQLTITPEQAIIAAAGEFGFLANPQLVEQDGIKNVFSDPQFLDLATEPRVFHVGPNDDRFAYQVLISFKDSAKQLQYQLVLVDGTTSEILYNNSLMNTAFRGQVWPKFPTGTVDARTIITFPDAWMDATRRTQGNNVIAATDIDANNSIGANETQPTADANGDFFFPWNTNSPTVRSAAVVNLFAQNNIFHDHLASLGFTEAAGNFQTNNFGLGGAGNDAVRADAQDGSGTDNANFGTPPDGSPPRMQMFLFTITGGNQEDSDFDMSIIAHEYTHGLSNRLVNGGSTGCLNGIQSGGMGEGWGDYLGGSFLNDPVVGAYVTGNFTRGIRRSSMSGSPFTYANIKDGSMTQVHDAGEVWSATLFKIREALGAATTDRLVVAGLKLTPCNPTMLQARDAIITADANINGGANKCALRAAFANRQMGTGASSTNHNSTSTIVLSTAIPTECGGTPPPTGTTTTFTSTNVNKAIPDNNTTGASSTVAVSGLGKVLSAKVTTNITHTFIGDLRITLTSPAGVVSVLSANAGGSADNFIVTDLDVSSSFLNVASTGTWTLKAVDNAAQDVGVINSFKLTLVTEGAVATAGFQGNATINGAIPDNNTTGISSTINATTAGVQVQSVQVKLNITHPFRGDLTVSLTSPAGETRTVVAPVASDSADNITGTFDVVGFTAGTNGTGNWTIKVVDKAAVDTGSFGSWSLGVNKVAL
jgi:subtilisin-like proprotein convertase family protein